MNLWVTIPETVSETISDEHQKERKVQKLERKELGDFFELEDYTILIKDLSNFYMYNMFIKQFIRLTPIDRFECIFLKVKDPYILTDLMFFMAIYNENKLKLASGGTDLD